MSLRKFAKGQPCHLRLAPYCLRFPETTVLAHLPRLAPGVTGIAQKCPDWFSTVACQQCHGIIDGRPDRFDWSSPDDRAIAERAMMRTRREYLMSFVEQSTASAIAAINDVAQCAHKGEAWAEVEALQLFQKFLASGLALPRQDVDRLKGLLDQCVEPHLTVVPTEAPF